MLEEHKELLENYGTKKEKIEILNKELKEMNDHIVGLMQSLDTGMLETDEFLFQMRGRAVWKYSDDVKELEVIMKSKKKDEQQTGKAKSSTTEYLMFKKK